jgi:hypothetical protein
MSKCCGWMYVDIQSLDDRLISVHFSEGATFFFETLFILTFGYWQIKRQTK